MQTISSTASMADGLRGPLRALRRWWASAPMLGGVSMVVILAAFGRPGPVWAVVYFVVGFAGGAYFRRIDTSRRFGARELQVEFYTAQDERRLPEQIHPPWWHEHIIAERNRLRKQRLQGWVIALFGLWAAAMLVAQASIAGFRLVPTGILVLYLLVCAGYVAWYRLMRPSLLADLDELARQGRSRGYRDPSDHLPFGDDGRNRSLGDSAPK